METADEIAATLANEWLAMMSAIPWSDFAKSIRGRAPAPCGETTSIETPRGLFDVSDSEEWIHDEDGDIRLKIEVFADSDTPLATRSAVIERPR